MTRWVDLMVCVCAHLHSPLWTVCGRLTSQELTVKRPVFCTHRCSAPKRLERGLIRFMSQCGYSMHYAHEQSLHMASWAHAHQPTVTVSICRRGWVITIS